MRDLSLTPSVKGTPQGGVISPMLANVALTCIDEEVRDRYELRGMNPIVRYADDFVITAKSEKEAENIKLHIGEYLKSEVGLTLSDEKTHITEISEGFDFLGFNFRKYGNKLMIKPSRKNVRGVRRKVQDILNSTNKTVTIIKKLNPIIIGWGNYYHHVVSKQTYSQIDREMWDMIARWIKKKHPNSPKIQERYFKSIKGDNWIFFDKETNVTLSKMAKIPIKRFIKVRSDMRVFDGNASEYWKRREYMNAKDSINRSDITTKLFRRQKGQCVYCKQPITDEQVRESAIHKHHLKPRSEGGDCKLGNLRLIHVECHHSLHGLYSRKEMADFINKGIDYL